LNKIPPLRKMGSGTSPVKNPEEEINPEPDAGEGE
jgi:hypothetical protein